MGKLSKLKKGNRAEILSFDDKLLSKSMMLGLGLLPGDEIILVSESFLGSPLTIKLSDGETIAMRLNEASCINVKIVA
jgi:Fe2+ transport system protein FeoA